MKERTINAINDILKDCNQEQLDKILFYVQNNDMIISNNIIDNEIRIYSLDDYRKLSELRRDMYKLNSGISLWYIGLKETPSEAEMIKINTEIGRWIKVLRDINEKNQH